MVAGLLLDYLLGLPTSALVSADHEDSGPEPGQPNGSRQSNACVGPRYQYSLVFHVPRSVPWFDCCRGEDTRKVATDTPV